MYILSVLECLNLFNCMKENNKQIEDFDIRIGLFNSFILVTFSKYKKNTSILVDSFNPRKS